MTEEFCLSDTIEYAHTHEPKWGDDVIRVRDVKEFIRRLKEELVESFGVQHENRINSRIDKLAGEKLI